MVTPYYVEEHKIRSDGTSRKVVEYALHEAGNGPVVFGTDLVFMHKIADVLNEDAIRADIGR